ncbi:MAG: haloacid dehalogenase superfamily protein subfamily variant 3 with third motif having or [Actinomycetia bacterium]|nr:haloacid dehalogenase superfamily protein subfamily variant 3 with third motif having or [Actinomycetes bacterium]
MRYRAVIFDIGGVIYPSPFEGIRAYERSIGLEPGFLGALIHAQGHDGAWSAMERGEIDPRQFATAFALECRDAGAPVAVDGAAFMAAMSSGAGPRPEMLAAVAVLQAAGLRTAALTNNWQPLDSGGSEMVELMSHFDVVIESSVVGLRKPDPRIYELVCERLRVEPSEAVFLDDLGVNLKGARALGIATIKVDDPDVALAELGALVGLDLAGHAATG